MRYWWAVGGVILLAAWGRGLVVEARPADPKPDPALVKRGDYIVNRVALCGDCHTPRDAKGRLDLTRSLEGAPIPFTPRSKPKEWEDHAPNITAGGKPGKWGEQKLIRYLTTGVNGEGEKASAPMPAYNLSPEDAKAVTAYLLSLNGDNKGAAKKHDQEREDDKKKGGKKRDDG
jgi:mono/diheme cytochrome c family protein